jgi:hypothetical protein
MATAFWKQVMDFFVFAPLKLGPPEIVVCLDNPGALGDEVLPETHTVLPRGIVLSPLAFFEVQNEGFSNSVELDQGMDYKAPRGSHPVDVDILGGKMLKSIYYLIPIEADIDEAIVATPAIAVDHTFRTDSAPEVLL